MPSGPSSGVMNSSVDSSVCVKRFTTQASSFRWSPGHCLLLLVALYLVPVLFYVFVAFLRKPHIMVVWDSLYYKDLFWAFTHDSPFDLTHHFRVSPLYPLSLLPTALLQGYLQIAQAQLALSAVYYFSGVFPLYRLGCLFGERRTGLLTALLFVIYPSSVYSSWIMSEAVSVPVFLFVLCLACEVMLKAAIWNTLVLGLATGLLMLSRPQGLFLGPVILLLIAVLRRREDRFWIPPFFAGLAGCFLAVAVWTSLGYISSKGLALTYLSVTRETPSPLASVFPSIFQTALHASALWMEGGLLIFPLGLLGGWCLIPSGRRGMIAKLCLSVAFLVLLGVAFHVARHMNEGVDRPVLRYAFYSNLALLPLAAWVLLNGHLSQQFNQRSLSILIVSLSLMLLWPHVWRHMRELDFYFANAPSLLVYSRMDDWPTVAVWALLTFIGLSASALVVRGPLVGTLVVVVLLGIVTRHSVDHCLHVQNRALQKFGLEGVHTLCNQLERGDWEGVPVVCQYDPYVDFLARDILFFVDTDRIRLASEYDGRRPYLFVTFNPLPGERQVMESGGLKAYLMTGPDQGPPPANYTPGPPPWG